MIINRIIRLLFSTIGLLFIVPTILSVCIWFFGGYVGFGTFYPLDGMMGRILAISGIWLVVVIALIIILIRRRRREKELTDEIVEAVDVSPEDELIQGEIGELRGKLRTALSQLRKSKFGRKNLYELPWYVIIGPPGAGKTTAIVNSGLNFPLAETMGKEAVGGVGGTRNCDWWFTDEAVLLDTAGRYTTQDSDGEADNAAWVGFLELLKRYRKRQPINGAIVAISVSDLSLQDVETQKSHARAVRFRLNELRERLGVRFPVYVLFTKADLIAGFAEYYEPLSKEDREQVWGFTLKIKKGKDETPATAAFDEEFGALLGRLNAQTLGKMQAETDPQRRSLIAGFPGQVASVRQVARDFLAEVFQENRYEKRHLLRGVYFTSGTQEGTPIDRLMMGMARTFGIGRQAIGTGRGTGRSFFLTRLFEEVLFPEAGLVSADDKVERRYKYSLWGSVAATIVIALIAGVIWTRSYLGNTQLISEADASTQTYISAAALIPGSPVSDTDLPSLVPALNTLRTVRTNPAQGDIDEPSSLKWGLYQGEVIGNQAAQSYRAALNQHFLPRLLLRLEEQMQSAMNQPDVLYESLKIYLMLGQQGPLSADLVEEWMRADWERSFGGLSQQELRDNLSAHLSAMLRQPMVTITLNGPMIEQVRQILREMPMAQRIYTGILNSSEATALPPWRVSDIGGANLNRAMVRSSGVALSDGIDGIFTCRGFRDVFLPQAIGVSSKIQSEAWVLGEAANVTDSPEALAATARDVLDLYYTDYIAQYDALLADLDIVPLTSLNHAVEVTNVLSGPTSPIRNVLTGVADETRLTEPCDEQLVGGEALAEAGDRLLALELTERLTARDRVIFDILAGSSGGVGGGGGGPDRQPGYFVEERFAWLQTLVLGDEGVPSQLDELILNLTEVYQELNEMSFAGGIAQPTNGPTALQRFQQKASRVGGPLQRWGTQVSTGSSGITAEGTRAQLNAKWTAEVLPFCSGAVDDRYPFNKRGRSEAKIQDFARVFAPGGLIDAFFEQNLRRHVDTQTQPWTWKTVNGAELGMSDTALAQFQNAAEIRDTFFSAGPTPAISFNVEPEALDPKAKTVLLEVDGQQLGFDHRSQPTPVKMTWPGSVGFARISFTPEQNGAESLLKRDGDWGWFRLLDAAQVRRTNQPDKKRVIFTVGGRLAIFQLTAGSVLNPFSLPALQNFKCPKSL